MKLLRTTIEKVECILKESKPARDSDKVLWAIYVYKYLNVRPDTRMDELVSMILDGNVPTFETISRARRKIQEKGKYAGSRKKERKDLEKYFASYFAS